MSNVLHKAFTLSRPQDPACLGNLPKHGRSRRTRLCGASRQRDNLKASASLVADWQPPSLVTFYAAGAILRANVSSAAAKPTPLLRPAQTPIGPLPVAVRQQP